MEQPLVHLVYIHGFQGDHTTFQAFPTDLQNYLTEKKGSLRFNVQSSLYPTYKSVKPISYAAKNFLQWLETQPPGPVILLGHSMGGLLAAEAATSISNNTPPYSKPSRIVGMIAFDCPYLGMHPHVIVSGIASLFPKDDGNKKTEAELNDHPKVNIVHQDVTEEALKGDWSKSPLTSPTSEQSSFQQQKSGSSSLLSRAQNFITEHSDDPLVRWARKHSDEPFTAGRRWIVEHFQFGSCMFDPSGLKDRYTHLVSWKGTWVNYWTQTKPIHPENQCKPEEHTETVSPEDQTAFNDLGLLELGVNGPFIASPMNPDTKSREKQRKELEKKMKRDVKNEKGKDKVKAGRHFIVLPTGLGQVLGGGEKWEKVVIGGVDDEVAAHCGLFIRDQNLEYDAFVERVGTRVLGWMQNL